MVTSSAETMQRNLQPQVKISRRRSSLVVGVLLMTTGVGLLLFKEQDFSQFFLLLQGLAMLLLGIFTHTAGWIIPGGIVSGIGAAILVDESPLTGAYAFLNKDALILLSIGAGFSSITLFTRLFTGKSHSWALIPGGILGGFGILIQLQEAGLLVEDALERYWPATLVILGAVLVYRQLRQK